MEQCCKEAVEEMGACYEMKHEMAYPVLSLEEDCELIQDTVNAMAEERITANKMIIGEVMQMCLRDTDIRASFWDVE